MHELMNMMWVQSMVRRNKPGARDVNEGKALGAWESPIVVDLQSTGPAQAIEVNGTFLRTRLCHIVHTTMNYMAKQRGSSHLKGLAREVGSFIRYWGFRRIHGEIWTVLFLSETPLSGVQIGKQLGVSKALVSPALKQLMAEGLIARSTGKDAREYVYQAVEDVESVILTVLKRREVPMLQKIERQFGQFRKGAGQGFSQARIARLGAMIIASRSMLEMLVDAQEVPWS
jgi:predicted transcriptional regulator